MAYSHRQRLGEWSPVGSHGLWLYLYPDELSDPDYAPTVDFHPAAPFQVRCRRPLPAGFWLQDHPPAEDGEPDTAELRPGVDDVRLISADTIRRARQELM